MLSTRTRLALSIVFALSPGLDRSHAPRAQAAKAAPKAQDPKSQDPKSRGGKKAEPQQAKAATLPRVRLLWKCPGEGKRPSFRTLAVHDGIVVATERRVGVFGIDAKTGKVAWRHEPSGRFGSADGVTLTRDEGFDAALVSGDDGLLALDRRTGRKLWLAELDGGATPPACNHEFAFSASKKGVLYGIELRTGRQKWSLDFVKDRPDDPEGFAGERARFGGFPARPSGADADARMVYLTVFDQCRVLAAEAATGKKRWSFQTGGWVYGRPTIGRRDVYVSSQDRKFYAVSKTKGELAWSFKARFRNEAPVAAGRRLVLAPSCDGHLYAIDRALGSQVWKFEADKNGKYRPSMYSKPHIDGKRVVLATLSGQVYGIDLESGKRLWKVDVGSEVNGIAVEGDRFYVTTRKIGDSKGESAVFAYAIP